MKAPQLTDSVTGLAIIFAACLWAAITILEKPAPTPRYQIISGGQPGLTYRLHTRTGAMWLCAGFSCKPMPWADVPADPMDALDKPANPQSH